MKNKKVELLAPAKNLECAVSAINYGADAVYIGANSFGARQNATNNLDDIKQLVDYAHKFYVKVFCTVNTILDDKELLKAKELIENLYKIGVDAIIIQDMGLLKLDLPPIPLHASTQCDNRNLEKVKFYEEVGLERVILARETSLKEIENICKNTNVEIETFIHGALCVSYSGQCYLSEYIGNRSANRGCCAQPCRKKYTLMDENGKVLAKDKHLLCLKDFNASPYIKNLIDAGVLSFKIEGRLKDENYIKNVTAYYRQLIDKYADKTSSGIIEYDFTPDVNKSFNRGFTTYCLDENRDMYNFNSPKSLGEYIGKVTKVSDKYFEYKGKELNNGDGICFFVNNEMKGTLVNRVENNRVFLKDTKALKVGLDFYRNQDVQFDKQLKNSKTKRRIRVEMIYENNILTAKDEDCNFVTVDITQTEIPNNHQKMKETFIEQLQKSGDSDFRVENVSVLGYLPFLRVSEINALRREILDRLMEERLKNYKRHAQKKLKHAQYPLKSMDYKANVYNKLAKEFYEECGCKITVLAFEKNHKVKNLELMRTKHCLYRVFNRCKSPKQLILMDETGKKYSLMHDCSHCEMVICEQM